MNNLLRQHYLQAIGIQSWLLRSSIEEIEDIEEVEEPENTEAEIVSQQRAVLRAQSPQSIIHREQPHAEVNPPPAEFPAAAQKVIPPAPEKKQAVLVPAQLEETIQPVSELQQSISQCRQCPARAGRLNALAGQGNQDASVFVISEPPNAEEDRAGSYLSGQAQSLFSAMLQSIQVHQNYFFTGIIKCFSINDYLFSDEEVKHCSEHLRAQIEQTRPAVILVLGAAPSQTMLQSKKSFNELRGKAYSVTINNHDYPLVISYHPAYLLRNPLYKREALKDLILLKNLLK